MSDFCAHNSTVPTATIAHALRVLAEGMDSEDGVVEATMLQAAERLDVLESEADWFAKELTFHSRAKPWHNESTEEYWRNAARKAVSSAKEQGNGN